MNIVDDFDALRHQFAYDEHTESFGAPGSDPALIISPNVAGALGEVPLLTVDTTIRQATRGRGHVLCVACASEHILVATTRGFVLHYSWDEYGNEKVCEVEVVKSSGESGITGLWTDPTATHTLIAACMQASPELYYLNTRSLKPRPLAKLKGTAITAVGWAATSAAAGHPAPDPPASLGAGRKTDSVASGGGGAAGAQALDANCTGPVLLGSAQGSLCVLSVDERTAAKKEVPVPKQLMALHDRRQPITGLHQERLKDGCHLVLLATPAALYVARGPPGSTTVEAVFAPFAAAPMAPALTAMPPARGPAQEEQHAGSTPPPSSTLHVVCAADGSSGSSTRFAWRVGGLVYHGEVQPHPPVPPPLTSLSTSTSPAPSRAPSPGPLAFPGGPPSASSPTAHTSLTVGPHSASTTSTATAAAATASSQLDDSDAEMCLTGEGLLRHVAVLPLSAGPVKDSRAGQPAGMPGSGGGAAAATVPGSGGSSSSSAAMLGAAAGSSLLGGGMGHSLSPAAMPAPAGDPAALEEEPRAMVMSEYHFVVVAGDRVRAINRVNGLCVSEMVFRSPLLARAVSGEISRTIDGLVQDPVTRACYMYSDESLYEVQLRHESRNMWRVYMEQRDWDAALRMCGSSQQRDEVHRARAEAAFAVKDLDTAAVHWAKVVGGNPPFEDVALRLMEAEAPTALMRFLRTRLSCLGKTDRAQATMVAAWLTELMLDHINQQLLQGGGASSHGHAAAEQALRDFIHAQVEVLDVGTTVTLLGSYGRLDDLLAFAQARADHEAVLEALLQRPGGAAQALAVLRKPSCAPALAYRFAPGLMAAAPLETVDHLISTRPALEPRLLIPALLRYSEPQAAAAGRAAVLRYVEFALDVLGCQDSTVHNLAAALHSLAEGEAGLLAYLTRAHTPGGKALYDPKYVLRLATERSKPRAAVRLLCELGMYEDAVLKALDEDLELAKSVASSPGEDEEGLRRRLWLIIAQHVVQQGGDGAPGNEHQAAAIKQAVEFLKEAGGLLKIEDVLPFFPDFVTIDNFKDAICDSLERYNRQIDALKSEMEESTEIADAVRADLAALGTRTAATSLAAPCARCGRSLADTPPDSALGALPAGGAMPALLVFPSGLVYHGSCCAAEVCELAAPVIRQRVRSTATQLGRRRRDDEGAQVLLLQLLDDIGAEDPRNGELVVRLVDAPYLASADKSEAASWVV